MGVVVRTEAPWKTLPELLAYAKANPGKLNWGTLGIGSTQHLAMERVGMAQGLSWTHAPYRGTADTLRALLGGEIDFAQVLRLGADGRAGGAAAAVSPPSARFPDVPTVETRHDVVIDSPGGLTAQGHGSAVVAVLADAFRAAARPRASGVENMDQPLSCRWARLRRRWRDLREEGGLRR
jgi:tripartite-type tricarboxylate transporter receptor subunit TctC